MKISNANLGESFEDYFKKCLALKSWKVSRIPNGCRVLFGGKKIIPIKSPFDFFATKAGGLSFYCDCKTTIGETFPYSAINQSQVKELLDHERNGHVAGYVVNFRQVNMFCFISASQLARVVPGASIKAKMSVDLGREIDIEKLFGESKST